jgi:hypothetical protein
MNHIWYGDCCFSVAYLSVFVVDFLDKLAGFWSFFRSRRVLLDSFPVQSTFDPFESVPLTMSESFAHVQFGSTIRFGFEPHCFHSCGCVGASKDHPKQCEWLLSHHQTEDCW